MTASQTHPHTRAFICLECGTLTHRHLTSKYRRLKCSTCGHATPHAAPFLRTREFATREDDYRAHQYAQAHWHQVIHAAGALGVIIVPDGRDTLVAARRPYVCVSVPDQWCACQKIAAFRSAMDWMIFGDVDQRVSEYPRPGEGACARLAARLGVLA